MLRPGDIRRIQERHALVIAGNAPPIIAKMRRCFDGKDGKALKTELEQGRARVVASRARTASVADRTAAAVAYARAHRLTPGSLPDADGSAAGENAQTRGWNW